MAQRLRDLDLKPDLIVSSPANRAMLTAAVVAELFEIDSDSIQTESDIYEGTVSDIIRVIRGLEDTASCAIIFGHNPGFTYAANALCGTAIDNIPTCGVVCIDFPYESWREVVGEDGTLVFFDFPKNSSGPIRPR
jgi:phosphohistidine phosphatase